MHWQRLRAPDTTPTACGIASRTETFDITGDELRQLNLNAARVAFLDDADRLKLTAVINAAYGQAVARETA